MDLIPLIDDSTTIEATAMNFFKMPEQHFLRDIWGIEKLLLLPGLRDKNRGLSYRVSKLYLPGHLTQRL